MISRIIEPTRAYCQHCHTMVEFDYGLEDGIKFCIECNRPLPESKETPVTNFDFDIKTCRINPYSLRGGDVILVDGRETEKIVVRDDGFNLSNGRVDVWAYDPNGVPNASQIRADLISGVVGHEIMGGADLDRGSTDDAPIGVVDRKGLIALKKGDILECKGSWAGWKVVSAEDQDTPSLKIFWWTKKGNLRKSQTIRDTSVVRVIGREDVE